MLARRPVMSKRPSSTAIIESVKLHGLPNARIASRAIVATLHVLGERLTDDEASLVAAALPPDLARVIEQREYESDFDAAELYRRVAAIAKASPGDAREQVDVVLRVIADLLSDEARARVMRALPPELRVRFEAESFDPPPPHGEGLPPARHTLSSGKPGSAHPLSEAHPAGHRHSVANAPNPHGDRKLSSARG